MVDRGEQVSCSHFHLETLTLYDAGIEDTASSPDCKHPNILMLEVK